jgi:hypothetical protein
MPASDKNTFRYAVNTLPTTLDPTMCNSLTDNELQHAVTEGLTRTTGGMSTPDLLSSLKLPKTAGHLRRILNSGMQRISGLIQRK